MIKNNKGLTLVNLIATLVLMLIITYITVSLVVGDEGVINEADTIRNQSEIEDIKEKIYLSVIKNTAENGDIDIDAIKNELQNGDIKNIKLEDSKIKFEYKGIEYTVDVNDVSDTVKAGYNNSSTPNAPYLMSGMEPVKWDENGNESKTTENDKDWYNYDEQKWANAKTVEDGSYWVWIPRYEYKITYYKTADKDTIENNESTEKTLYGKIDINFIPKEKTIPTDGYKIHPAFTDGTDNYFDNGEWDKEVSGIWVAKFLASCEQGTEKDGKIEWSTKKNTSINDAMLLTKKSGNTENIRMVFQPNKNVWNYISVSRAYINSYKYDREKESHLLKNSEYGMIAYISYSRFGLNGNVPNIKSGSTSNFITSELSELNTSTTGNITGIYDLTNISNTGEYISAYVATSNQYMENTIEKWELYTSEFIDNTIYNEVKDKRSTKYITRYPFKKENYKEGYNANNYREENYKTLIEYYKYGDAIFETSISKGNGILNTFGNTTKTSMYGALMPYIIFHRGGMFGIFSFRINNMVCQVPSCFRVVLIGE